MARAARRLSTNVEGDFFVDDACIDCGTCRWMAPEVFGRGGPKACVHRQPDGPTQTRRALRALVSCPVAAIGAEEKHEVAAVSAEFPVEVSPGVFHCGFHHRSSFGAASYLVVRASGNVLIDSPRFAGPLVKRIEELGGVQSMFLTHRDDVADHAKFAAHFGCERILHRDDVTGSTREVEVQPTGSEPIQLAEDLLMLPVPGHTRGSACLLFEERVLFTGDHLAWDLSKERLYAFRRACWFDWPTQVESMKSLASYRFGQVLPGHGAPVALELEAMAEELQRCLEWMAAQS